MGYIPKSLVNTGLYTNGGEFIDPSTGKFYKGYFHSPRWCNFYFKLLVKGVDFGLQSFHNLVSFILI